MPRGVYDRSKLTKKNKTEAAPAVAKAPKGKRGRKPGAQAKSAAPAKQTAESRVSYGNDSLSLFATVRANIETLTLVSDKFGAVIPGINAEVAAHVEIMSTLRKQVFGTNETEEATPEVEATSNGTSAQPTQYATSVPMPPSPIPSIPATH